MRAKRFYVDACVCTLPAAVRKKPKIKELTPEEDKELMVGGWHCPRYFARQNTN